MMRFKWGMGGSNNNEIKMEGGGHEETIMLTIDLYHRDSMKKQ